MTTAGLRVTDHQDGVVGSAAPVGEDEAQARPEAMD